jgi:hypothetical protein
VGGPGISISARDSSQTPKPVCGARTRPQLGPMEPDGTRPSHVQMEPVRHTSQPFEIGDGTRPPLAVFFAPVATNEWERRGARSKDAHTNAGLRKRRAVFAHEDRRVARVTSRIEFHVNVGVLAVVLIVTGTDDQKHAVGLASVLQTMPVANTRGESGTIAREQHVLACVRHERCFTCKHHHEFIFVGVPVGG